MPSLTPEQLRDAFDLASIDEASLSPWATVHRGVTRDGRAVVIKRTGAKPDCAQAMADWTRHLAAAGIPTVSPVELPGENPRQIMVAADGDDDHSETAWWVAYPFIEGRPYDGSAADLEAAGDLLGRLHALDLPADINHRLRSYDWPETDRSDVDDDLETLDEVFAAHAADHAEAASASVRALAERWWHTALPTLRAADDAEPLPRAAVTSDWKACNLVFTDSGPVLVDPDNGGVEPRLFDLALALVLFHNECPTAPGRLMTADEWATFATAYQRHVTLTARERDLWPLAVSHMLWEEGTWALEDNDADAWADSRQGGQLIDLALTPHTRHRLP